jgi:hypothetical protein
MAEVEIPEMMPLDLPTRDSGDGNPVQVARHVRGADVGVLEAAIAHLAGGRLLPPPASARQLQLTTSYQVCRVRFARPIICRYVLVRAVITGSGVINGVTGDFRVNSDHTASYTTGTWALASGDSSVEVELLHPIGGGAVQGHAEQYMTVNVEARYSGGGSYYLEQLRVIPLHIGVPTGDYTVTT